MSLFEGTAAPNVTTTDTTAVSAPQYLTDYLTQLAQTGQSALSVPGSEQVAALPQNLQDVYANAGTNLSSYQPAMTAAQGALTTAAGGVTPEGISKFYNPYQQQVVDEAARQSGLNVQRNVLPALRGAFAGTGGFGSKRYATAAGQTLGDIEQNLLGEQNKLRSAGYQSSIDSALKELGLDIQAGQGLTNLGSAEASAATSSAKTLADLGTQQLAYEQSKIDAPLTRAQNVAKLLQGYNFPTTTTKTYTGPASSYSPSALQQIAGLGTLLGSGFSSDAGWGNKLTGTLSGWLNKLSNPTANPTDTSGVTEVANTATEGQEGYGWRNFSDGTSIDPYGNYYYQGQQVYTNPANINSPGGSGWGTDLGTDEVID